MSLFDSLRRLFGAERDGASERRGGGGHGSQGISCQEALRLVHEFIDGELENVSQAEVQRHFEICARCYPHLRLEQSFREAVRRACAREHAPPELRERVLHIVSGGGTDA